jgi:glycosyltransferase involved in cell wall biosynthesis
MKKIVFFFSIFNLQDYGGISKYIYNISNNINNNNHFKILKLPFIHSNLNAKSYNYYFYFKSFFLKKFIRLINLIVNFFLAKIFYKRIFINSYFEKINHNTITIVYDLIPELIEFKIYNQSFFDKRKKIITNSKKIIAISKTTKNDLVKFYKINPKKINVIYPAGFSEDKINLIKISSKSHEYDIPKNFFLFVGTRSGYKNFEILLKLSIFYNSVNKNIFFVVYGGGKFNEDENFFLKKNNLLKNFIKVDGDENFLFTLYSNANCLIYPSKYEGFGMPIIEAFQSGCPVVSTKNGSISEIGGDAILYFNNNDFNDLYRKLEYLPLVSKKLVAKGYNRSKKFKWSMSRNKFYRLLEKFNAR